MKAWEQRSWGKTMVQQFQRLRQENELRLGIPGLATIEQELISDWKKGNKKTKKQLLKTLGWDMMVHTFYPSTQETEEAGDLCECKARLFYKVSSRPTKTTLWDPVYFNRTKTKTKKKEREKRKVEKGLWSEGGSNLTPSPVLRKTGSLTPQQTERNIACC